MSHPSLTLVPPAPTPRDFVLGKLLVDIRKEVRGQFWAEGSGEDVPETRKAALRQVTQRVLLERSGGAREQYEEYLLAAGRIRLTLDKYDVESWLHLFPWLTGQAADYLLGHALAVIATWVTQDLLADEAIHEEDLKRRRRRRRPVRTVQG